MFYSLTLLYVTVLMTKYKSMIFIRLEVSKLSKISILIFIAHVWVSSDTWMTDKIGTEILK